MFPTADHSPAQAVDVLEAAAKHGVEFVNLQFTDILGKVKSVSIPIEQLPDTIARGKWYPEMPPVLDGEDAGQYTDRLTGADRTNRVPYHHKRNRQCSIGYHSECSDPAGESCECPCHVERALAEYPAEILSAMRVLADAGVDADDYQDALDALDAAATEADRQASV